MVFLDHFIQIDSIFPFHETRAKACLIIRQMSTVAEPELAILSEGSIFCFRTTLKAQTVDERVVKVKRAGGFVTTSTVAVL